jgi:hypothetical protein
VPAVVAPGRLIAVEGTRGVDVAGTARKVLEALDAHAVEAGVSRFDASGTFFEAAQVKKREFQLSPRTLLLLYAADLQFRLRWEILPIVAEGRTVIAAPFTGTAQAFGLAAGMPREWLAALFAGVPEADVRLRAKERGLREGWRLSAAEGFGEACALALWSSGSQLDPGAVRLRMIEVLDGMEGQGRIHRARRKRLKKVARAMAQSRQGQAAGSSSSRT